MWIELATAADGEALFRRHLWGEVVGGGGGSRAGHEILKRSSSSQKEGRFPRNRRNEFRNGKTSNGRTEDSLYLAKGSVEAAGEQVFALASLLACQLFF